MKIKDLSTKISGVGFEAAEIEMDHFEVIFVLCFFGLYKLGIFSQKGAAGLPHN